MDEFGNTWLDFPTCPHCEAQLEVGEVVPPEIEYVAMFEPGPAPQGVLPGMEAAHG